MKQKKLNIVLTDFVPKKDWAFFDVLRASTGEVWICKNKQTNHLHSSKRLNLVRIIWYFLFPIYILFSRKGYDKIIAWQQFYGLNMAFFSRIFHLKKVNKLYVLTFIYKRKEGVVGSLYHRYMNYIVNCKYVDKFICFAKEEVDYYNAIFDCKEKDRFVFVPLGLTLNYKGEVVDKGYVFATGRSNRNYDFLMHVLNKCSYDTKIACDTYSPDVEVKDNIKFEKNCYGNEMLQLMAYSHVVVVPLKNIYISSGQLVILQAMALGKPVICTKSNCVTDYIDNGITGLLVNNMVRDWQAALELIYKDESLYQNMVLNSQKVFQERFTEEVMYKNIAQIVK